MSRCLRRCHRLGLFESDFSIACYNAAAPIGPTRCGIFMQVHPELRFQQLHEQIPCCALLLDLLKRMLLIQGGVEAVSDRTGHHPELLWRLPLGHDEKRLLYTCAISLKRVHEAVQYLLPRSQNTAHLAISCITNCGACSHLLS